MTINWLSKFHATQWIGTGELWLDPNGNEVDVCECTMSIESNKLNYTWAYQNEKKQGCFEFFDGGAKWQDSWHQPEISHCLALPATRGLFTIEHSYPAPPGPDWGWRSQLSERPDGHLILQMTNIAPWGEEGRAVRMLFRRHKMGVEGRQQ